MALHPNMSDQKEAVQELWIKESPEEVQFAHKAQYEIAPPCEK